MLDGRLHPRTRSALRFDDRPSVAAVVMGDIDLQFRGVPRALLADIVAQFTGRDTLDAICARYPEPATRIVRLVASEMRTRGMLLMSTNGRDAWPGEDELPLGGTTWRYVLDRVADPVEAWRRWRTDLVIVTGRGMSFATMFVGLLDAGIGRLGIGPDVLTDRADLIDRLAEQAGFDGAFAWHWWEPGAPIDPAAVLVRVTDDDALARDGWAERIRSHPGRRVIAGVTGPGGVVVRMTKGGSARVSMDDPATCGTTMSRYALTVLGNMAAFQTLNVVVAGEQAAGEALLPLGETMRINPDGGFAAVDPVTAITGNDHADRHPAGAEIAVSPHQREREHWIAMSRPFFDGSEPLLAWDDDAPLPVFPLPHRALLIVPGDEENRERVVTWAVSPSEVTARTLRRGLESLADRLEETAGHAVGVDNDAWRARAYVAWAEAHAPTRIVETPSWQLLYEDVGDIEFRTLVRLIGLYLGDIPHVGISLDAQSGMARADAAAGAFRRFALGTSPLGAAVEALGRVLSAFQLGEAPGADPHMPPGQAVACHLALAERGSVQPERFGLVAHMLDRLGGIPVRDFLVGRFRPGDGDA